MLPWNSITIQVEGILRVYWVPINGPERLLYAVRINGGNRVDLNDDLVLARGVQNQTPGTIYTRGHDVDLRVYEVDVVNQIISPRSPDEQ